MAGKKLLAVDGNSILNRAFYGIRDLTNSAGLHTNAVYGMITMLSKYLSDIEPDYAAVAFDLRAPTFRHLAYDGYKATRKGMPEELAEQLPYAKRVCQALGFRIIEKEGFEADDILGTLSARAPELGAFTCIVTGDRDSLQLVSENTSVYLATNTDYVIYDVPTFKAKYGVTPELLVDIKALMGDSSDNIPGVPGIGEKTALSLVAQFGELDRLYSEYESSSLAPSVKKKLFEGREKAYLSKMLATINREVSLDFDLSELAYPGTDKREMLELCKTLEFSAIIKRLGLEEAEKASLPAEEYASTTPDSVDLSGAKELSVALIPERSVCRVTAGEKNYEVVYSSLTELSFIFEDPERSVVCYDYKNLRSVFACEGMGFENCTFDIMLAAYVLDSNLGSYDYPRTVLSALGVVAGEEQSSAIIASVAAAQKEKLAATGQLELFCSVELPFARVLSDMEREGFCVDREGLEKYSAQLRDMEHELSERIYAEAGCEFNINSPKQLGEVLFERLGLPAGKKTKKGYSTSAEILEHLAPYSEVVRDVLEYRKVTKLRGTYGDGLLKVITDDGRIHTAFKQTGTATGRISSAEPNLQNIPIRTELGRELRRYFIPKDGDHVLIDADYSQIELRLLAHISGDEAMIAAFNSGADFHSATASKVFRVPLELVTPELRKRAKAVNFGIVYGIGDFSLASDLGISRKQAGEYIKDYLATYSGVDAYLKGTIEKAREQGYVTTLFGRRRYIPELAAKNKMTQSFGERVAMNSPIQGTAADIIKIAMINAAKALSSEGLRAGLILQVHDEIIVEAHREDSERAAAILRESMELAVSLSVPLCVEISVGENWFDAK